jgi:hypothetical protein
MISGPVHAERGSVALLRARLRLRPWTRCLASPVHLCMAVIFAMALLLAVRYGVLCVVRIMFVLPA